MQFWLRPSTEDDFEFVFQLNKINMRHYVEQLRGWDDVAERCDMQQKFYPGCDQTIVIDSNDAGIFGVDRKSNMIELRHIEILPKYQRLGVGTALINNLLNDARQAKLPVLLCVLKMNPVLHLYESLGFRITGETNLKYQMIAMIDS
jgi:GNAT superfamily N-acetyltransferase